MFKLVVLLSVVAMAVARPNLVAPVVYSSVVSPATSSISEYSTSVAHGSPVLYRAPAVAVAPVVVSAPAVVPALAPYHHVGKRSVVVAPWSYGPVGSWALPAAVGYPAVYPRALSWHPY